MDARVSLASLMKTLCSCLLTNADNLSTVKYCWLVIICTGCMFYVLYAFKSLKLKDIMHLFGYNIITLMFKAFLKVLSLLSGLTSLTMSQCGIGRSPSAGHWCNHAMLRISILEEEGSSNEQRSPFISIALLGGDSKNLTRP